VEEIDYHFGDDGRFELRGVQSGVPLVVRAEASGFAAATSTPVEVARGGTHAGVELQLGAAGSVRVRAAPELPFAAVTATREPADDKAVPVFVMVRNGTALLTGLTPGTWRLELRVGRQPPQQRRVEVVAGQTAEAQF